MFNKAFIILTFFVVFLFLNLPLEHEEEVARIEKYAEILKNEDSVSKCRT